ncbi:MAG: hypothetical protein RL070_1476 [Bacteroidota bacterium]|jgi:hypothetical protein
MKNPQRSFDDIQIEHLGDYVYALKNPINGKIFYVGVGVENRIFYHFNEADDVVTGKQKISKKTATIIDIWNAGFDVEWFIVAHSLPDRSYAFKIEAALIDAFREIQTVNEISNDQGGHHSSKLLPDDLVSISAPFVNPDTSYASVFLFSIQNASQNRDNVYDATRAYWKVSEQYKKQLNSYAVGIVNNISKSSFKIDTWYKDDTYRKDAFVSPGHPNPVVYQALLNKNWSKIIAAAKGFWQRGQYLIVEFDGNGKFRIIRGLKDPDKWFDC